MNIVLLKDMVSSCLVVCVVNCRNLIMINEYEVFTFKSFLLLSDYMHKPFNFSLPWVVMLLKYFLYRWPLDYFQDYIKNNGDNPNCTAIYK